MRQLKVVHLITHFALGGAAEQLMFACELADHERFQPRILCGKTALGEQDHHEAASFTLTTLPSLKRAVAPSFELRAYVDLVRWFRRHPCDIVHTHSSKAGIIGRLAAARAGVPVIVHTVHGWGHHDYMRPSVRRFYVTLERRAAKVSDRIITVSRANREKGIADGIGRPEQYAVIYPGVNVARYQNVTVDREALRHSLRIPSNAPVVGTVSRLARQKAPDDFLRVAELVREKHPAVRFLMAGGGPMQKHVEKQIRQRGLQDTVSLLGYRHDIPELLRTFDVFLLTSLWEGLPAVIPQAMCAGLPTVATAVDGTPETVVEGETGYLLNPHDCEGMADRLVGLIDDPNRCRQMGQAASDHVSPLFSLQSMVRDMETIYLDCARAKNLLIDIPVREVDPRSVLRPQTD